MVKRRSSVPNASNVYRVITIKMNFYNGRRNFFDKAR